MRDRLDLRQCAYPAQELDPQPDGKPPSDAAHWPEGQGISPDPKLGAAADGDGEGSAAGDAETGGSPKPDVEAETEAMEVEQAAVRAGSQQVAPTSGITNTFFTLSLTHCMPARLVWDICMTAVPKMLDGNNKGIYVAHV